MKNSFHSSSFSHAIACPRPPPPKPLPMQHSISSPVSSYRFRVIQVRYQLLKKQIIIFRIRNYARDGSGVKLIKLILTHYWYSSECWESQMLNGKSNMVPWAAHTFPPTIFLVSILITSPHLNNLPDYTVFWSSIFHIIENMYLRIIKGLGLLRFVLIINS